MKKLLTAALLALSSFAFGATLVPIQLLNPAGSAAGQVIRSTGSSTAPAWAPLATGDLPVVPVSKGGTNSTSASGTALDNITGFAGTGFVKRTGAGAYSFIADPLPIANGGTGQTSAGAALTALGAAPTASPTFTGTPATPTAAAGTNTTQIASTAYVQTALTGGANSASLTTIAASGAITPSQTAGIVGTTTNNNANAGAVGEYPNNSTAGTSLTTATTANATSTPLTAGDWDVQCTATFVPVGVAPTIFAVGISTTSATLPGSNTGGFTQISGTFPSGAAQVFVSPTVRVALASSGTSYCVVQSTFSGGTQTVNGFIRARRPR